MPTTMLLACEAGKIGVEGPVLLCWYKPRGIMTHRGLFFHWQIYMPDKRIFRWISNEFECHSLTTKLTQCFQGSKFESTSLTSIFSSCIVQIYRMRVLTWSNRKPGLPRSRLLSSLARRGHTVVSFLRNSSRVTSSIDQTSVIVEQGDAKSSAHIKAAAVFQSWPQGKEDIGDTAANLLPFQLNGQSVQPYPDISSFQKPSNCNKIQVAWSSIWARATQEYRSISHQASSLVTSWPICKQKTHSWFCERSSTDSSDLVIP